MRCPFATARNNLDIVFVKNTSRTAKLQADMDRALGDVDDVDRRRRSLGHQATRLLLARVVSLVGTLHTAEDFNNNVVAAPALADAICAEIRRLLALGSITDGTLLKMAVVLIFTVVDLDHPTHFRGGGDGGDGNGNGGETKEDRGNSGGGGGSGGADSSASHAACTASPLAIFVKGHALRVCCMLLSCISTHVRDTLGVAGSMSSHTPQQRLKSKAAKMIGVVSMMCEWFRVNPDLLHWPAPALRARLQGDGEAGSGVCRSGVGGVLGNGGSSGSSGSTGSSGGSSSGWLVGTTARQLARMREVVASVDAARDAALEEVRQTVVDMATLLLPPGDPVSAVLLDNHHPPLDTQTLLDYDVVKEERELVGLEPLNASPRMAAATEKVFGGDAPPASAVAVLTAGQAAMAAHVRLLLLRQFLDAYTARVSTHDTRGGTRGTDGNEGTEGTGGTGGTDGMDGSWGNGGMAGPVPTDLSPSPPSQELGVGGGGQPLPQTVPQQGGWAGGATGGAIGGATGGLWQGGGGGEEGDGEEGGSAAIQSSSIGGMRGRAATLLAVRHAMCVMNDLHDVNYPNRVCSSCVLIVCAIVHCPLVSPSFLLHGSSVYTRMLL